MHTYLIFHQWLHKKTNLQADNERTEAGQRKWALFLHLQHHSYTDAHSAPIHTHTRAKK